MNNQPKPNFRSFMKAMFITGLICVLLSFIVPFIIPGAKSMSEPMSDIQTTVMFSLLGSGAGIMMLTLVIAAAKQRKALIAGQTSQSDQAQARKGQRFIIIISSILTVAIAMAVLIIISPSKQEQPVPIDTKMLAAITPVASGQGIADARRYQPDSTGVHKLVILYPDGQPYPLWNFLLPSDWLAKTVEETELVAFVSPDKQIEYTSKVYQSGGGGQVIVTGYFLEIDIELREAATGRIVGYASMRGTEPYFPWELYYSNEPPKYINGDKVPYESVETWLCQYVSKQRNWTKLRDLEDSTGFEGCFSPDGEQMASSLDGLSILRVSDGSIIAQPDLEGVNQASKQFSNDWQYIATMGEDKILRVYQDFNQVPIFTLKLEVEDTTYAVWALSPDGSLLAVKGGKDGTKIQLWSVASGALLRTLTGHKYQIRNLTFSPDNHLLASEAGRNDGRKQSDNNVLLWSVDEGKLMRTFMTYSFFKPTFSWDSQMIAMAGEKEGLNVQIRKVSDSSLVQTLKGYGSPSYAAFSRDGGMLAYSTIGAVRLWDLRDGKLLRNLEVPANFNYGGAPVAFSPDGQYLVSGTHMWQFK